MSIMQEVKAISTFYGKGLITDFLRTHTGTREVMRLKVKIIFEDETEIIFRSDTNCNNRKWQATSISKNGHAKTFIYRIKQIYGHKYIDRKLVKGKYIEALFSLIVKE